MTIEDLWAIGIDLGGTKIQIAQVEAGGRVAGRRRLSTNVKSGPKIIEEEIIEAVKEMKDNAGSQPVGLGIGVAGQIDQHGGIVLFAPNLGWRDISLRNDLNQALSMPVVITNDVRAATWGEWLHGAGQGCNDLICLFIGTGIGGGIVSGGRMLTGSSNTAGELGHITIDLNGPFCRCGNRGCLEALAGGWAIAQRAQEAISLDRVSGSYLLELTEGRLGAVTAKTVVQAAQSGNSLAIQLVEEIREALIAGAVSLINAFNPGRLILGGGVIQGMPQLIEQIDLGVRQRALEAAVNSLQILPARLQDDAGVVGAATLVIKSFFHKAH